MKVEQEPDVVSSGTMVMVAIASIGAFVAAVGLSSLLLHGRSAAPVPHVASHPFDREGEGQQLRREQQAELKRYRRIDGENAQIPIDRAMDMVAGGRP